VTTFALARGNVSRVQPLRVVGRVASLRGLVVLVSELWVPVGSLVSFSGHAEARLDHQGGVLRGEVVGFTPDATMVMLLGQTTGVCPGDRVICEEIHQTAPVGDGLLGRCIDGLGRPIDGDRPPMDLIARPLSPEPIVAMKRRRINQALHTGVRAVDLMATLGRGQRMGIFAGPGVGKSTLLGTIARGTSADVNVIALIGERGRDVLLMMDSITRFAHAQRQIGLSIGEPPATKGYTPSVFAQMAQLLERAGTLEPPPGRRPGSITGLYTILVEGDDTSEPISDAARGILDGHIMLSRKLAHKGHFPAIDVLDSVSRVADDVITPEHAAARRQVSRLLALYREVEDLVQIGAYAKGSSPESDVAIEANRTINDLLRQAKGDAGAFEPARAALLKIAKDTSDRSRPKPR